MLRRSPTSLDHRGASLLSRDWSRDLRTPVNRVLSVEACGARFGFGILCAFALGRWSDFKTVNIQIVAYLDAHLDGKPQQVDCAVYLMGKEKTHQVFLICLTDLFSNDASSSMNSGT